MTAAIATTWPDAGLFVGAWPIEDIDQTLGELRAQAERDLADLLFNSGVQAAGAPSWQTADVDIERPWLVVMLPVVAWSDPVRARSRRSTTPIGGAR